jgi:hypothetical protein
MSSTKFRPQEINMTTVKTQSKIRDELSKKVNEG